MLTDYETASHALVSILDFFRFGLTEANRHPLYYGHGTDNAWDDIYSLVVETLALPYQFDNVLWQARLTEHEKKTLAHRLFRRIHERIPVPYLTNKAYFCNLEFYVDERVLIPRSPISELIQQQFSPWISPDQVTHILDLCTGSGCIAIACCDAFPDALVDAVDISKEALQVAEINKAQYQLTDELCLIESDCFSNVPLKSYDIIVSNPPYVGVEEMQTLPDEYRHEPTLALETAENGLAIVEKILKSAHHYLGKHGILIVEVGNSEEALLEVYPEVPFTWLEFEHGGQGVFLLTYSQLKEYFADE